MTAEWDGTEGLTSTVTPCLRTSGMHARECGPKGITINAVSPGPAETALFTKGKTEAQIENIKHLSAFDRLGELEEITKIILFLVSPDAAWMTGQMITWSETWKTLNKGEEEDER